jgi:hypothetical protein
MRTGILAATFLVLVSAFAAPSSAEPISFAFEFRATEVGPGFSLAFPNEDLQVGDRIVGSVVINSTGPDQLPDPHSALFEPNGSITLPFIRMPLQVITVSNDIQELPAPGEDGVGFSVIDYPLTPHNAFGEPFVSGILGFVDASGDLLNSDALPSVSTLQRFPRKFFQLTFNAQDEDATIFEETVTRISAPAPVPEPASIVLLCSGIVGFASLRRRLPVSGGTGYQNQQR